MSANKIMIPSDTSIIITLSDLVNKYIKFAEIPRPEHDCLELHALVHSMSGIDYETLAEISNDGLEIKDVKKQLESVLLHSLINEFFEKDGMCKEDAGEHKED